jgi:hypothetical protein
MKPRNARRRKRSNRASNYTQQNAEPLRRDADYVEGIRDNARRLAVLRDFL